MVSFSLTSETHFENTQPHRVARAGIPYYTGGLGRSTASDNRPPLADSLKDILRDVLKDSLQDSLKDFLKDSLKDILWKFSRA